MIGKIDLIDMYVEEIKGNLKFLENFIKNIGVIIIMVGLLFTLVYLVK